MEWRKGDEMVLLVSLPFAESQWNFCACCERKAVVKRSAARNQFRNFTIYYLSNRKLILVIWNSKNKKTKMKERKEEVNLHQLSRQSPLRWLLKGNLEKMKNQKKWNENLKLPKCVTTSWWSPPPHKFPSDFLTFSSFLFRRIKSLHQIRIHDDRNEKIATRCATFFTHQKSSQFFITIILLVLFFLM